MLRQRHRAVTWQQELLLSAALAEGPASLAACEKWRARVDLEHLDYDSQRLLPLLYATLRRQGISDPEMGRFKGIYRRTWYDNTLRLHAAATAVQRLGEAGIETILLEGAALALRYYRDLGLRPLDAVDILVTTQHEREAMAVLNAIGWTLVEPTAIAEAGVPAVHRVHRLRNAHGHEVNVHRRVFGQRLTPSAEGDLWAAARPVALAGAPTQVLGLADQLLHVCEHGMGWTWWDEDRPANPCWVADAAMILRNPPEALDWDRLSARAQRFRLVLPLREALRYLHDLLGTPVPASALARISTVSVPLAERVAERARTRPPRRWGPWVALGVRYLEYSASLPPGTGRFRRIAGAPAFFQRRWGSAPLWQLPFVAFSRGLRRMRWAAEEQRARRSSASTQHTRP